MIIQLSEKDSTDDVSEESVSRRGFLRTAGATAMVGAGALGATNSVGAISKTEGSQDGPSDFPRFSTRDNYSVTWYGSTQEEAEWWEYEKWGDFNGYGIYDGDELVIHIHGWTNDYESAVDGSYTSDVALSQDGNYDQPVAGWSWDADKGTWWNATTIAETVRPSHTRRTSSSRTTPERPSAGYHPHSADVSPRRVSNS